MRVSFKHLAYFLPILLAACGGGAGGGGTSSSSSGSQYSGESLEGGNVSALTFNSDNLASIEFGSVTDSSEYIIAVHSYNSAGSTIAFQMGSSADLSADFMAPPLALSDDINEDFHEHLRNLENELNLDAALDSNSSAPQAVVKAAALGSTRNFKVLSSFSGSSTTTVTAVLRYETDNFLFYIDQRNTGSLSDADVESLAEPFNDVIGDERGFFGQESDVDSDGKFNVLLTQEVNELGGSAGGIITGFFYAVDLFDADTYAASNETEIFYTFVPDPSGSYGVAISKEFAMTNILPSVMPHEYQHMINFNMHYLVNGGAAEKSFLNEALSHLAEDIYSLNGSGYMTTTGIENPARISGYLDSIDSICITCGSSLYQRGGSYLLVRYLYEQAQKGNLSGAASGLILLNQLVDTNLTGVDNIINAAYGTDDADAFTDLMGQFGLAVFLDGTDLTEDDRLVFDGIDLRGLMDDNRGTDLQGPIVNSASSFPLSQTVAGASINYIQVTGTQINDQSGTLSVQLSDGATAGAYLIQTGL